MKPVRLTIQAFGPYPDQTAIDFRSAVDSGLFGIYGPTGSGKSTLFSAMTFALFGEPAKSEQDATSLRSDHADPGTLTEVEFVFDMGGRRYVVLRRPEQMRQKQRGDGEKKSAHEAYLFDATGIALENIKDGNRGPNLAEKKVRDVDLAIETLLGYGAAQFRQIVLLPQGRFEAFLSAKTKERLDILRELFDVSRYRAVMAKLKVDADDAERAVREERAVCQGRLTADGFESSVALGDGIAAAQVHQALLQDAEIAANAAFEASEGGLQEALQVEALFQAVETAHKLLASLQAGQANMDLLATRIQKAEQASTLRDVEVRVVEANAAVATAEEKCKQSEGAVADAGVRAQAADGTLKQEADRAAEIDALRLRIDALARHRETLDKAADVTQTLTDAKAREHEAVKALEDSRQRLAGLQTPRRTKAEELKAAESIEVRRAELSASLTAIKAALTESEAFEKATRQVQAAQTDVSGSVARNQTATQAAQKARNAYEDAEQKLAAAQAQHLASKLVDGEPCAVCGATEHPVPASGTIEAAGREQAFRSAKAALQVAESQAHKATQELAGFKAILQERQDHLSGLATPQETSATLKGKESALRQDFQGLGPKLDVAAAQAEIDLLDIEIAALEIERETLQADLTKQQHDTTTYGARLAEMLSPVPQNLRDLTALEATQKAASRELALRETAKQKIETAAKAAREAEIAASKDQEAARSLVALSKDQQQKAKESFSARLAQTQMSEQDYRAIKPFIGTLEQDRRTVAEYQRKIDNARETATNAASAIGELQRPPLPDLEALRDAAQQTLTNAREERSATAHQLGHLISLRDSLADAMRRLDESEAASGPLRGLAALVNGDNAQRLDLETFAIGAMFDQVLEAANLRLGPMTSDRYRVQRDKEGGGRGRRGLGIEVFDVHTGKPRPTATLSGGESFIAALALALGLADIVESASGKVRLDTIFIDEGFGSLDAEDSSGTLDRVLDALATLVSQSRAVGLISHVRQVQEAIPNGFYIRKHPSGSSSVEIRGGT